MGGKKQAKAANLQGRTFADVVAEAAIEESQGTQYEEDESEEDESEEDEDEKDEHPEYSAFTDTLPSRNRFTRPNVYVPPDNAQAYAPAKKPAMPTQLELQKRRRIERRERRLKKFGRGKVKETHEM